jgi:Zn ribbon nucleic-acid-binding protein
MSVCGAVVAAHADQDAEARWRGEDGSMREANACTHKSNGA